MIIDPQKLACGRARTAGRDPARRGRGCAPRGRDSARRGRDSASRGRTAHGVGVSPPAWARGLPHRVGVTAHGVGVSPPGVGVDSARRGRDPARALHDMTRPPQYSALERCVTGPSSWCWARRGLRGLLGALCRPPGRRSRDPPGPMGGPRPARRRTPRARPRARRGRWPAPTASSPTRPATRRPPRPWARSS